jgi:ABC-2 type transport system permease protein
MESSATYTAKSSEAKRISIGKYLSGILTLAEFDLRKLRHDPMQVWVRLVQPVLWLAIFGTVMSNFRLIPPGYFDYRQFLAPGVLAQSVMFVAIFYGINVVWERDLGQLNKLLSTPTSRSAIVLGKTLSAGIRGIFQAVAIIILALIMRIDISLNPLNILGILVITVLFGMCFSGLSLCLASVFKTRERMMGIGQAITMPLFFASNAIYPISAMPDWVRYIATVNPLTYFVDALRATLVTGNFSQLPLDTAVIIGSTSILIGLASWRFRKMVA